jgi:hypothetical protein
MKRLIVLLTFLAGCATTSEGPMFFGGTIVGPYVQHFDGKLECANVRGWYQEVRCMCHITDPAFSDDKSFIWSMPQACKEKE